MKKEIISELEKRWVTKEELSALLGMNVRCVRAEMEKLNQELSIRGKCVLSTSRKKGYHIPNPECEEDVELARCAVRELSNKAISIFSKRKAIKFFVDCNFPADANCVLPIEV